MNLFSKIFGKSPSPGEALAEAVYQDASEAFQRFQSQHGTDCINGFSLCTVNDACPPYIKGITLEAQFGPVGQRPQDLREGEPNGFNAEPADWCWKDKGPPYRCESIIGQILDQKDRPFEERAGVIFRGMVNGLKKFDASGQFKGRLPREQMLLMLWIHDPDHARWVMDWVAELNPPAVSAWFNAVYSYRDYA